MPHKESAKSGRSPGAVGVVCQLCGGSAVPTLIGRRDYEYGIARRLNYWHCLTCGYVFTDPVPSAELRSFYVSYTTHAQNAAPAGTLWRIARAITPKADGYGAFSSIGVSHSARILDFGCGGGEFLTFLNKSGYCNLFGYDFDRKAAAFRLPHISFLSRDEIQRNQFDVIVMNHVLEHVEGPAETFELLLSMLNDDGFLYIRTPNRRALLAGLFG